jgi:hypothetical protein
MEDTTTQPTKKQKASSTKASKKEEEPETPIISPEASHPFGLYLTNVNFI